MLKTINKLILLCSIAIMGCTALSGCEAISRGEETICVGICKHTEVETSGRITEDGCRITKEKLER